MIQAYVFTGFLGSGKTTLMLQSIQNYFKDKTVAVVVNEFGDIGIDGTVIQNVHSQVMEISEGCICCQLAQEFEAGVTEVVNKYNPEVLFVEASGASEPFPIYLSLQNLGMSVEGVLCVIDVKHFHLYKDDATAKYQIGGSNILVLNKTDTVDEATLTQVEQEVVAIKNRYDLKNNLTGETIFKSCMLVKAHNGVFETNPFEGALSIEDISSLARQSHGTHPHHTQGLEQHVVFIADDVSFAEVDALLKEAPKHIIRIKGVVRFKDVPKPLAVHYVFGDVTYEELDRYEGRSVLVWIGNDVRDTLYKLQEQFSFLRVPRFKA